jgi:peptide/nickel transport system substrate-binding protein
VARSYISTNIVKGNPFTNQGAYMNPEVDRLFAQGASAPSDALRQEAYTKVQQLLAEEVPVLWLLELEFSTIYRCNVKNLVTTAIGVNDGFRDAWKE